MRLSYTKLLKWKITIITYYLLYIISHYGISMSVTNEHKFSSYGNYTVSDKLDLYLPKTEIHIERKSDNRISYYRKNSINQEIRKSIPQSNDSIRFELCPVLPLH